MKKRRTEKTKGKSLRAMVNDQELIIAFLKREVAEWKEIAIERGKMLDEITASLDRSMDYTLY